MRYAIEDNVGSSPPAISINFARINIMSWKIMLQVTCKEAERRVVTFSNSFKKHSIRLAVCQSSGLGVSLFGKYSLNGLHTFASLAKAFSNFSAFSNIK